MFCGIIATPSCSGWPGYPALSSGLAECGLVVFHYILISATHWSQMPFEAREGGCLGCVDKLRSPWLFVSIWRGPGRKHKAVVHLGILLH